MRLCYDAGDLVERGSELTNGGYVMPQIRRADGLGEGFLKIHQVWPRGETSEAAVSDLARCPS
jgi:hypothetical protein